LKARLICAALALVGCEMKFIAGMPACTQPPEECAQAYMIPVPDGPVMDAGPVVPPDGPILAPTPGSWQPIATTGAPTPHGYAATVWTGRELVMLGGQAADPDLKTYAYDPATDRWRTSASDRPASLSPTGMAAVWTGSEVLTFGLAVDADGMPAPGGGGRYEPAADRWDLLPAEGSPAGRSFPNALWTGSELVVFGGRSTGSPLSTAATFTPGAAAWQALPDGPAAESVAATVAGNMIFVMSNGSPVTLDLARRGWVPVDGTGLNASPDKGAAPVWSGSEVFVVGGGIPRGSVLVRWNPATRTWSDLPMFLGFRSLFGATGAWLGDMLLVGGGAQDQHPYGRGHLYRPGTADWVDMTPSTILGAPDLSLHWTGTELLAWSAAQAQGGRWRP
jgi:hypothetical protein